jgi:hypothetical protein
MTGSGRNANHRDTQAKASNVVPFPGRHHADRPERSDTDGAAEAVAPSPAAEDQPQTWNTYQDIIGADSFWDGNSDWLHQPLADPDPGDGVPRPAAGSGGVGAEDGGDASTPPAAESPRSGEQPAFTPRRPPVSRAQLLAWCAAALLVLVVLGAVLPRVLTFGPHSHKLTASSLPHGTVGRAGTVRNGSIALGSGAFDADAARDHPLQIQSADRTDSGHRRGTRRVVHHHHHAGHAAPSPEAVGNPVTADGGSETGDAASDGAASVSDSASSSAATSGASTVASDEASASQTTSSSSTSCDGGSGSLAPNGCRGNATP